MTVGELKAKLEQFPDDMWVMILDADSPVGYTPVLNITRGVNEYDGCLFIDNFVEDEE